MNVGKYLDRGGSVICSFCAKEKISENLDSLDLTCKLHFLPAFTKPDFYRSQLIEIPISRVSEIKSRITIKDILANLVGTSLIVAGVFSDSSDTVSFASCLLGGSIGEFSAELPNYIHWISTQLIPFFIVKYP